MRKLLIFSNSAKECGMSVSVRDLLMSSIYVIITVHRTIAA
jgi:hypothetical protein